jgi:hypothetical protein
MFIGSNNGADKFNGDVADLWWAPGVYLDLTVTANRRKFISADRRPVPLGANGQTPTGSAPLIFLSGDLAAWHTNKGTGGGLTQTGALSETPATGVIKCFNTPKTCQDRENYVNAPATLRFAVDTGYLPPDIDCIPSIRDIAFSPATISLGEDLGQRATLSITFEDHRHSDTGPGFDKYRSERPYDPFRQGTFWGKWRARQPFLRGRPVRLIRGLLGQTLAQMQTRHYVIESFDGPTPEGTYTLVAKDVLKLADNDRSQAPRLSNGFLAAAITNAATSATLSPSGIGDLEYPASGYVAIGGKEICAFTRSGNTLTLTRGQLGTQAQAHDAEDRVQLVLRYVGLDPATIIADLLQTYAGVDPAFIDLATWQAEVNTYLQRVYTATIAEPTGVKTLISELIEQAALALWWDDAAQTIRLQVLRPVPTGALSFGEDSVIEGSLRSREQPEKRLSQVWTYFGKRNPLEPHDDPDNYRSALATVDLEAESNYGTPVIRKIYSRWIPAFGRTTAERLNQIILGRFRDPPRRFEFALWPYSHSVALGGGYQLASWFIQDAAGAPASAPIQITRLNPDVDRLQIEAEEMLFQNQGALDLTHRVVTVDSNFNNFNLRATHDTLYPVLTDADVVAGVTLKCVIDSGVIVGSSSVALPAFDTGTFPAGLPITIEVRGRIQGKGGDGGRGRSTFQPVTWDNGQPGGTALKVRVPITLINATGQIWGGGGGGQGGITIDGFAGGGGGGAGKEPGAGGVAFNSSTQHGQPGTTEAGGAGGSSAGSAVRPASNGGGPGQSAPGDDGGAAGAAIDGVSLVTISGAPGDRRGPEIN